MLLLVALMTVGLLVVQSANRELSESGAIVARERATMSAHAALQLAGALFRQQIAADPGNVEALLATALTAWLRGLSWSPPPVQAASKLSWPRGAPQPFGAWAENRSLLLRALSESIVALKLRILSFCDFVILSFCHFVILKLRILTIWARVPELRFGREPVKLNVRPAAPPSSSNNAP